MDHNDAQQIIDDINYEIINDEDVEDNEDNDENEGYLQRLNIALFGIDQDDDNDNNQYDNDDHDHHHHHHDDNDIIDAVDIPAHIANNVHDYVNRLRMYLSRSENDGEPFQDMEFEIWVPPAVRYPMNDPDVISDLHREIDRCIDNVTVSFMEGDIHPIIPNDASDDLKIAILTLRGFVIPVLNMYRIYVNSGLKCRHHYDPEYQQDCHDRFNDFLEDFEHAKDHYNNIRYPQQVE